MTHRSPIKGEKKTGADYINEAYGDLMQRMLDASRSLSEICNIKPLSKAEQAKYDKKQKAWELKEKKRRAKKITMTVGELEDKISEAEDRYSDY